MRNVFVQPKKLKVGQDESADEQWGLQALAAKMIALRIFTHQLYVIIYTYTWNSYVIKKSLIGL